MSEAKRKFSAQGPDRRSLAWFLAFRVLIITLFLGGASLFFLTGKMGGDIAPLLFLLLTISYLQALLSAFALLWMKRYDLFAQVQLLWDLLFVTALILITGGIESSFSFVYLLVIVAGGFLLSRRQTLYVACTAAILFGGLLDLQYFGYLPFLQPPTVIAYGPYLYAVFVHVLAFVLTGLLSGTLAQRWRVSEEELQRKKIDYAELERLNRTILSHISSGLMIVNRRGRIRSFNQAASDITGYALEEVYDRKLVDFFPKLEVIRDAEYTITPRAETCIQNRSKETLVIGYATTPIRERNDSDVGLLVSFQDLTQFRQIEEQLKRADRLAAVGRMAAGMAHEIRNPLASISGSVQMLLEDKQLEPQNRQLMGIVQREADRLGTLLGEFLVFARPRPPENELIEMAGFLAEVVKLLHSDQRCKDVQIDIHCSNEAKLSADRHMLHQAVWNLLLNAADAAKPGGQVLVSFDDRLQLMTVEDNGPGVDSRIRHRLFDPFVSTKEQGSGLGLAAVYTIAQAHGAKINLGTSRYGGAAFYLSFQE